MNIHLRVPGLVILLCGQMLALNAYAELQAFVDRSTILESQTIEFTLRANSQGDPDFSELEKHFRILGSRTNSQYQSINGRVSSWIDWNLTLEPRSIGELTIPGIKLNAESSRPITIQVNALDPELRAAIQSLVFFETEISAKSVYVQAQLIFTRKLYYARGAQLYGETPGTPEIENALVRIVTQVAPVSVNISGRPYTLIEQRYAIFPERSGQLVIPAAAASGNVRLRAQPGFVGGRTRIRAISESIEITVKPIPASYPATRPWLPASEVIVVEVWSEQPDNLVVGIPVTRVLMVQAQASIGSVIPPLLPDFPKALRAYPQAPEISEHSNPKGMTGVRREEYSISAQRSGSIRLPEIELTWWDTDTDEVKVARISQQTIQVTLNPAAPDSMMNDETASALESKPSQLPEKPPEKEQEVENTVSEDYSDSWPLTFTQLALLVLSVALLIFAGRYFSRAKNRKSARERESFANLESSAGSQDLHQLKLQLTQWLGVFHQVPPDKALQTLDCDASSHRLLEALNRGIYAPTLDGIDTAHISSAIMELAEQHRQEKRSRKATVRKPHYSLPELFPVT